MENTEERPNVLDLLTEDYREIVDMCANNQVSAPLPNRSIDHAKILTKAIFRNATDKVEIFSGSLNEIFLKTVKESILDSLIKNPDLTVEVVLAHTDELNHVADSLNQHERVTFYKANEEYKNFSHFCVSGNMYRAEEPHPDDQDFRENAVVHAYANFNAPDTAAFLKDKFEAIKAEPIG